MKHTKRTLTLLLTAAMLSSCLLPIAGCKSTTTAPSSPFNDTLPPDKDSERDQTIGNGDKTSEPFNDTLPPPDKDNERDEAIGNGDKTSDENGDGNTVNDPSPFIDPDITWPQGTVTGEKRLYGKQNLYKPSTLKPGSMWTTILRYGDMLIGETSYENKMGYFPIDEPQNARLLCFDPLCKHLPFDGYCTSEICFYQSWSLEDISGPTLYEDLFVDPMNWYIDYYESTEAPVIYLYYRRSDVYTIGPEQEAKRDPLYCLERFDLAEGKRYALLDNVESTISYACNYGDHIYYVLDKGKRVGKELHKLDKSGKEVAMLELDKYADSVDLIDVVDDMFYYLIDEQYLYRCTLDLTDSEMVLDLSTLKGKEDSVGIMQGSYSGYLYYIADVEKVTIDFLNSKTSTEKANLYRIPMNDLEREPELVIEGINFMPNSYMFAEKTFYYSLCVGKAGITQPNYGDGKLMALNLVTGETKTIVENSEMNIYIKLAWDDMAVISGTGYTEKGESITGQNDFTCNYMFAYTSGKKYEFWTTVIGAMSDEYKEYLKTIK